MAGNKGPKSEILKQDRFQERPRASSIELNSMLEAL
jgi:hypothetical protein